jgi:hypothetical protein
MAAKVGLRVEVQGDDIVVILAGTSYVVTYSSKPLSQVFQAQRG